MKLTPDRRFVADVTIATFSQIGQAATRKTVLATFVVKIRSNDLKENI
jgi:hypothetical protein